MFDCSRWFIQLCYVTIGNVPFFPFQGFLCRCYKSGATTKDYSFYMLIAAEKMADNFRSAIARVHRIGDNKGIKQRKQAMLWLFQVFALTAGLYGCQVWVTFSLTYDSSKIPHTCPSPGLPEKTPGCQETY